MEPPLNTFTEIAELVHRIALASDLGTIEEWGELLTDDVEIDLFGDKSIGRDANLASAADRRQGGRTGPGSGVRHLVTTVVVRSDGDKAANSTATILLCKGSNPVEASRVVTYSDIFWMTPDGWRLARRHANFG